MSNFDLMNRLMSFVGCAVVVALVYGPLQAVIVDVVRRRFFELRDDLFDAAARGEISFSDPNYLRFREEINGLLRNAHEVTLWRALSISLASGLFGAERPEEDEPPEGGGAPYPQGHDLVKQSHKRMLFWMTALMWMRSPVVIVLTAVGVVIAVPFLIVGAVSASAREEPRRLFKRVKASLYKDAALEVMLFRGERRPA